MILSPSEIAYPEVVAPDVFLCLSHDAYAAYAHCVAPGALSIIDDRAVAGGLAADDAIVVPLTDTARECGATLVTNIVGLGTLIGIADLVSERSLREALAARVAPEHLALNTQAFTAGLQFATSCGRGAALPAST